MFLPGFGLNPIHSSAFREPEPWEGPVSHPDTGLPRACDWKTAKKETAGIQNCIGRVQADFQEMFSRPGAEFKMERRPWKSLHETAVVVAQRLHCLDAEKDGFCWCSGPGCTEKVRWGKGFSILISLSALKYSWPNLDPCYGLIVFSGKVQLNPERILGHLSAYR